MADKNTDEGYFYDTETGEVTFGRQAPWTRRMGPYATAEEARRALETARARSEAWDEEDRRDRD